MSYKSIYLFLSLLVVVSGSRCRGARGKSGSSSSSSSSSASSSSSSSESKEVPDFRYEYELSESVKVDLYYESLCPDCRAEYPELPPLIKDLGTYINLHTYPYGNAHMRKKNGRMEVKCQHGEQECYGNKLHACAIDYVQENVTAYVNYNACLMKKGSNDEAADECGQSQNIDSEPIKTCAKGDKGQRLLVYYGKQSEKVKYPGVPYVLINGVEKPEDVTYKKAVCDALKSPPDVCNSV